MGRLIALTTTVLEDEPCYLLEELHERRRRVQVLHVVRDGRRVEARLDLGPAVGFRTPQLRVVGGVTDEATGRFEVLHTVGQLRDIAEAQRSGRMAQPDPGEIPYWRGR